MQLRDKYLVIKNPEILSVWGRLRLFLAGLIYPELKDFRMDWHRDYFSYQYLLSVHHHYENEIRAHQRALTRYSKKNRQLQKRIEELELKLQ